MKKVFISLCLVVFLSVLAIEVSAHSIMLDIEYDECSGSTTDDYSKKWYDLLGKSYI